MLPHASTRNRNAVHIRSAAKEDSVASTSKQIIRFEDGSFDLVLCVRFLNRAWHTEIPRLLAQDGFVIYNSFLDMEGTRSFGRPKGEEHLLQPSELSALFKDLTVIQDDVQAGSLLSRERTGPMPHSMVSSPTGRGAAWP